MRDYELATMDRRMEEEYNTALDKRLYLAQRVKEASEYLTLCIPRLRDVRSNSNLLSAENLQDPLRRFNPSHDSHDNASQVGVTIAKILYFPKLLARFEQELTDSLNVSTQTILETRFSEKDVPPLTISALCIDPFTESDLNSLLSHLEAVTESTTLQGKVLTVAGSLEGKARGVISAFPAAFGVLSRANLFSADKKKWSEATLATYTLKLGKKVLSYEPNALKNGGNGSGAFDKYTDKSQRWLYDWQTNYTSKTGL